MDCKHGLLSQCCDDCKNEMLDVATQVYLSFKEDGFYGEYVLGKDLWERFKAAFDGTETN